MWKDPTDVTKRKPRRLRGTPAHRFTTLLAASIVGTICLFAGWYGSTNAEWVQRARQRVLKRISPQDWEAERREMFTDPVLGSAMRIMYEKDGIMKDAYIKSDEEDEN